MGFHSWLVPKKLLAIFLPRLSPPPKQRTPCAFGESKGGAVLSLHFRLGMPQSCKDRPVPIFPAQHIVLSLQHLVTFGSALSNLQPLIPAIFSILRSAAGALAVVLPIAELWSCSGQQRVNLWCCFPNQNLSLIEKYPHLALSFSEWYSYK